MTEYEREGRGEERGAVSVLRDRLGVRYQASIDDGRAEIARVLADEFHIGRDEAETMTRQLIDSGEIRYVTGVERDIDPNIPPTDETQSNVRHDSRDDSDRSGIGLADPHAVGRDHDRDHTRHDSGFAGGGGPIATAAGMHPGSASPVSAGTGGVLPGTVPAALGPGSDADDLGTGGGGYWDFGSGAAGVRPSTTRKGQVEPFGT